MYCLTLRPNKYQFNTNVVLFLAECYLFDFVFCKLKVVVNDILRTEHPLKKTLSPLLFVAFICSIKNTNRSGLNDNLHCCPLYILYNCFNVAPNGA